MERQRQRRQLADDEARAFGAHHPHRNISIARGEADDGGFGAELDGGGVFPGEQRGEIGGQHVGDHEFGCRQPHRALAFPGAQRGRIAPPAPRSVAR